MRRNGLHDGDSDEATGPGPDGMSGLGATPRWLRDLGTSAWLAVGITLFVVGAVWILSLTETIVTPVIAAGVVAAVASPVVGGLERRGLPRTAGAVLMLLGLVVLGVAIFAVILGGITGQTDALREQLAAAKDTLAGWLTDVGVDREAAETAKGDASSAVSAAVPALLQGIGGGLKSLSSLVFFLALTALSLIFLLKDGPQIRAWAEGHMGVPRSVAHTVGGRVLQSLRAYFFGVTIVALFNATVVLLGALLLGVPLAGTIAVVTFVGAYIPYLGAWSAGAFGVLVALGGAGPEAAAGMVVVQLLANGILQQLVQPIAFGATLGIHPLAVLIVTIAGGSLFGAVGLILAAPLVAAATKVSQDLSSEPAPGPPEGRPEREVAAVT